MMSASTGASSSGHQTSAPVARATGATAPTWSKWVWVSRIAATSSSSASIASSSRCGLVAGIDHDRLARAVAAGDVAVLLHRPDGEGADVHAQRFPACCGSARPALIIRRLQKKRSTW